MWVVVAIGHGDGDVDYAVNVLGQLLDEAELPCEVELAGDDDLATVDRHRDHGRKATEEIREHLASLVRELDELRND